MTTIHLDPDYQMIPVRPGFKVRYIRNGVDEWIEYIYYRVETREEWLKRKGLPPDPVYTPEELAIFEGRRKELIEFLRSRNFKKVEFTLIKQSISEVKPMELPSGILFWLDHAYGKI